MVQSIYLKIKNNLKENELYEIVSAQFPLEPYNRAEINRHSTEGGYAFKDDALLRLIGNIVSPSWNEVACKCEDCQQFKTIGDHATFLFGLNIESNRIGRHIFAGPGDQKTRVRLLYGYLQLLSQFLEDTKGFECYIDLSDCDLKNEEVFEMIEALHKAQNQKSNPSRKICCDTMKEFLEDTDDIFDYDSHTYRLIQGGCLPSKVYDFRYCPFCGTFQRSVVPK